MTPQAIKVKLLSVSLFAVSISGTFAIFGFVPMLAQLTAPNHRPSPNQPQAFPEIGRSTPVVKPAASASPERSRQARNLSPSESKAYQPSRFRSSL